MLPTHRLVATHDGRDIFLREPGFEFTPMLLGRIASFLVRGPSGDTTAYAFMVPLLEPGAFDDEALLELAVRCVTLLLPPGPAGPAERTFEYRAGSFTEVVQPPWLIPTLS